MSRGLVTELKLYKAEQHRRWELRRSHNSFCSSSLRQPGFAIGPWLHKDQATLPGKERLTKLFLVTGNLTPISDGGEAGM